MFRPLVRLMCVVACVAGCARVVPPAAVHVASTSTTAVPQHQPPVRCGPRHLRACTPKQRAALHRWLLLLAARQWIAGLPAPYVPYCGGDLPPCYVRERESHNTYGIVSTHYGCSGWHCYGAWQFDPTTLSDAARHVGLPELVETNGVQHLDRWSWYTPKMEDDAARYEWADGAGCAHWSAC